MNQLLKDAIADAKAVRETALANAKVALEEAFAPKLQSMLSHKIKEEMESDEKEEMSDEDQMEVARMQQMAGIVSEEDEEMPEDETSSEDEDDMDYEDEDDMDYEDEEDVDYEDNEDDVSDEDLDEILRELEDEDSVDPNAAEYDLNPANESEDPEAYDMKDENKMKMKKKSKMMEAEDEDEDEDVDLEEIINALREEDEEKMDDEEEFDLEEIVAALREEDEEEEEHDKDEELEEAYSVIKYLRSKLNEVNLLNAKLLFVNKLFRKNELNEAQKVKVIETFDRAKNVREAKLIYATLSESANKAKGNVAPKKKKVMAEGLASAPQKKTKILAESNEQFNRFKALVEYNNK